MYSTKIIETRKIAEDLYVMTETKSVHCYLMIGADKALLFDVGYGYESLMPIIRSITSLPVMVVLSHGDPDHALGSFHYPEVYIHPLDYGKLLINDNYDMKKKAVEYRAGKMPEFLSFISKEDYYNSSLDGVRVKFIKNNEIIDLRGKRIQVIHIPGHSYGCVALLDIEKRRLFTGDMVLDYNIYYFMSSDEQASFHTAEYSWKKLKSMENEYDDIFPAHGIMPIGVEYIENLIECMGHELKENYGNDMKIETFMGEAYQHRYKTVNILYSKERLEEFLQG